MRPILRFCACAYEVSTTADGALVTTSFCDFKATIFRTIVVWRCRDSYVVTKETGVGETAQFDVAIVVKKDMLGTYVSVMYTQLF